MFSRRLLLIAFLAAGLVAGGVAVAKNHRHHDAHGLLGAKIKQNGKHEVGKIANNTVTAEVSNNKVVNMSAGDLPVHKVRSKKKMASIETGIIQVSASGEFNLAQADVYYYAYCFDTPDSWECYWYPAEYVIVTDGWVDYVPG